jgi:CubicO group peptidase (beta-lactamase class C family)
VSGAVPVDGDLAALPRTFAELTAGVAARLHLGGQICVLRDGSAIADAAFGDVEAGSPMRRDHRMLWLSASKPVTALAMAQLWERGALGLDDEVARHLPEFGSGGKERITIRHLLTHTSGIRMLDTGWPEAPWDEVIARICARPVEPRWVPGRKAGYHLASSWFVLGELLRRLDGRPVERYLAEEFFAPLGMAASSLGVPRERWREVEPEVAPMYVRVGEALGRSDLAGEAKLVAPSPGGNGIGPLRELARLYEALRRGGDLDGRRILSPQTVEAVVARHRVGMFDQTFKTKLDWGLGVIVNSAHYGDPDAPYGYGPHAGPRTYGHSGARSSVAFCDPDARLVVALAVNGLIDERPHRARFERVLTALYEDLDLASDSEAVVRERAT